MSECVTNVELGRYFNKTEGAIRNTRKKQPKLYNAMINEYLNANVEEDADMAKKIILMVNLKGGVGKSTIANLLQSDTKKSVVFNIDLAQNALNSNSGETLNMADYLVDGVTLDEVMSSLKSEYKTIIVDTPGALDEQLNYMLGVTENFIIPLTPGNRSESHTIDTVTALFEVAEELFDKKPKVCFVINDYTKDENEETAKARLEKHLEDSGINKQIKYTFTKLKHSEAIRTMENDKDSIEGLQKKNRVAYAIVAKRIASMNQEIKEFFKLK